MHLLASGAAFITLLTITSAINYGGSQAHHSPSRLHFDKPHHHRYSSDEAVHVVEQIARLGKEIKHMRHESPKHAHQYHEPHPKYEEPKKYEPVSEPTTTTYVHDEEAARKYWNTHVPPVVTSPPVEDVPEVRPYEMPTEAPVESPIEEPVYIPPAEDVPVALPYVSHEEPTAPIETTTEYVPPAQDPTTPVYIAPVETTTVYVPPAQDPTTPAYVAPVETTTVYVPPAQDPTTPAYVAPVETTTVYVPPAQDPTTPAYVAPVETTTAYVPVTPDYVPPQDVPAVKPYEEPVPTTPVYAPSTEAIMTLPALYGPVAQDVPKVTYAPKKTTMKYVLNEEAAKKYWATAKFPTTTKAPEVPKDVPAANPYAPPSQDVATPYVPITKPQPIPAQEEPVKVHHGY